MPRQAKASGLIRVRQVGPREWEASTSGIITTATTRTKVLHKVAALMNRIDKHARQLAAASDSG